MTPYRHPQDTTAAGAFLRGCGGGLLVSSDQVQIRSPRAPPATSHQPGRGAMPQRDVACAATLVALRKTGGIARDGDRLDKAGQPGGPVSAVYSPTAALRHQRLALQRALLMAGDARPTQLSPRQALHGTAAS